MANEAIIGSVAIKVRPDTDGFRRQAGREIDEATRGLRPDIFLNPKAERREVQEALAEIKRQVQHERPAEYRVKVEANVAKAREEIERLKKEMEDGDWGKAKLAERQKLEANEADLLAKTRKAQAALNLEQGRMRKNPADILGRKLALNSLNESLEKARVKLHEFDAQSQRELEANPLVVKARGEIDESLRALPQKIRELRLQEKLKYRTMIDTLAARQEVERLRQDIEDERRHEKRNAIELKVESKGLAGVAAHLAYASRSRRVPFYVTVNEKSLLVAEGMLKSLAGLNVMSDTGRVLESIFTGFDRISLKAGGLLTILGSASDVVGQLATTLLSIGGDLGNLGGLAATAPAALAAVVSTAIVGVMAFKNFKDAVDGDAEALAALPPNARKAAESLQGVWTKIQQPVQKAFWEGMGTSLQDMVKETVPQFSKGLTGLGKQLGVLSSGVLKSFTELSQTGGLSTMFKNLEKGMGNAAKASKPLFDAINTIGLRGSEYFPQMGDWLNELATRFDKFIDKSDKAGDINRWIEEGVGALKDLWNVAGGTIGIFDALTKAANDAGANGLHSFAVRLGEISDMMHGSKFQTNMRNIFAGAREGAGRLNEGVKELFKTFGDGSETIAKVLSSTGGIGGNVLKDLSAALSQPKFQSGLLDVLQGMETATNNLRPGFQSLGQMIGTLGTIAGTAFAHISPIISQLAEMLNGVVQKLGPSLQNLVPTLTGTLSTGLSMLNGIVQPLASALGGLIDMFNGLPGPIKQTAVALGVLVAMRGSLGKLLGGLVTKSQTSFSSLIGLKSKDGQFVDTVTGKVKNLGDVLEGTGVRATAAFSPLRVAWQEQKRLVESTNPALREYGTSIESVGRGRAALGTLAQTFGNIKTAASGFRDSDITGKLSKIDGVAGSAARGLGSLTKIGIGGLVSALGGPWMIAIEAAILGISAISGANEKYKQNVDELKGSLDVASGAITSSTTAIINNRLSDAGTMEWAKTAGLNLDTLTQAAEGTKGAVSDLQSAMNAKDLKDFNEGMADAADINKGGYAGFEASYRKWFAGIFNIGSAAHTAGLETGDLAEQTKKAQDAAQLAAEQAKSQADAMGLTVPQMDALNQSTGILRDTTSDATSRLGAMKLALDQLNGTNSTMTASQRAVNKSFEDTVNGLKALKGVDLSKAMKKDGSFDPNKLFGANGQAFDLLNAHFDQVGTNAQNMYKSLVKGGKAPVEAAEAAFRSIKMTDGQMKELSDQTGLSIAKIKKGLKNELGANDQAKYVIGITGNTDAFEKAVTQAKQDGQSLSAEQFVAFLKANPDEANRTKDQVAADFKAWANSNPTAFIMANPTFFNQVMSGVKSQGVKFNESTFKAALDANPQAATWSIDKVIAYCVRYARMHPTTTVTANTGAAASRIQAILDMLAGLRDKDITLRTTSIFSEEHVSTGVRGGGGQTKNLNGAIRNGRGVKTFANGGFVEPAHVAQIANARSNMVRVFAEPETGGEAYIPMAANKRGRSTSILNRVADNFGYRLVKNVQANANGSAPVGGTTTFNINNHYPVAEKTSVSISKAMALAGAGIGLGD